MFLCQFFEHLEICFRGRLKSAEFYIVYSNFTLFSQLEMIPSDDGIMDKNVVVDDYVVP